MNFSRQDFGDGDFGEVGSGHLCLLRARLYNRSFPRKRESSFFALGPRFRGDERRVKHQYLFAIGSSSAGNSVITRQPLSVTTTSSSMRAAEYPSVAGQ
jgi:hypothetical protein